MTSAWARSTKTDWSSWRRICALGVPIATPVFDGAKESDIVDMLEQAGLTAVGPGDAV